MKQYIKHILALAVVVALLAGQAAHASALGGELIVRDLPLSSGVTLTESQLWSGSGLRTERYVSYTPGGGVTAAVYGGAYVSSLSTVSSAAAGLEGRGWRVVAAVNGGFFNPDGTIVGMLLTDGVLRAADVTNYAMVGVRADGSFFVDESPMVKTALWQLAGGTEYTAVIAGYNAYRNTFYKGDLFLYSNDFSSKVNSDGPNVSVLLQPGPGDRVAINGTAAMTVLSVSDCTGEGTVFNGHIPPGCYMLYAGASDDPTLWNRLLELTEGQRVTVSLSGASPAWADAVYGVSALETLVRNGQVTAGSDSAAAPRTALGIRADGSVVLYTIDGRQSGYSVGATYAQVAQRLVELGCVTAVALDGGSSTTLGATLPGSSGFSVLNRPSGGAERWVNNAIFLLAPGTATGHLEGYRLDADRGLVLAGSSLPVTAIPYDSAGYPTSGAAPVWSAAGGSISSDGLTAAYTPGETDGLHWITASSGGAQGTLSVRVISRLSSLSVTLADSGGSALTLSPGESAGLTATGRWYGLPVHFDNEDVSWSISGSMGTIDKTGRFTAGAPGEGWIVATAGHLTTSIPVTVNREDPFTDMNGHWACEYVTHLYRLGMTTGILQADGTYRFHPNGQITRGELLVFLTRLLGINTEEYTGVTLPLADVDSIPDWALPSVKAMYELQILAGVSNGEILTASTGDLVTRETAMTMLGRVLAAQVSCDLSRVFADWDTVSDWASPYVQTLVCSGVVEGSGGLLSPTAHIDRASAAKLLAKLSEMEIVQP